MINPVRRQTLSLRRVGAAACVALLTLSAARNALAQSGTPSCNVTFLVSSGPALSANDICQKANDLFRFIAPQIGVGLIGGNVVLGESGTLGKTGRFSVAIRASMVDGQLPSNIVPISYGTPTSASNFGSQRAPIPIPAVDGAVGVFRGLSVGVTNVGGVDLLAGGTYVRDVDKGSVALRKSGSGIAYNYGLRVGLLQESALVPGISVSYKRRSVPKSSISYGTQDDTITIRDLDVSSNSVRVVAGKHFAFFGISGGVGRDEISAKTAFTGVIRQAPFSEPGRLTVETAKQVFKRSSAFVDLSFGLPIVELVVEVGWSGKGNDVPTINTFNKRAANDSYRYYSAGLRVRPF